MRRYRKIDPIVSVLLRVVMQMLAIRKAKSTLIECAMMIDCYDRRSKRGCY